MCGGEINFLLFSVYLRGKCPIVLLLTVFRRVLVCVHSPLKTSAGCTDAARLAGNRFAATVAATRMPITTP